MQYNAILYSIITKEIAAKVNAVGTENRTVEAMVREKGQSWNEELLRIMLKMWRFIKDAANNIALFVRRLFSLIP